jgi:5'-deoxynucleotidase YfbR-like HD superfamily hydrolase
MCILTGSFCTDACHPQNPPRQIWTPEPRTDRNWFQTYTGREFWPLNPEPCEIYIEDIAHPLSQICRFTGHTREFYSVAEHCVRVSYQVQRLYLKIDRSPLRFERGRTIALAALMHDASEAYIADVSRPVKYSETFGPIYQAIEANLQSKINRRFDLPEHLPIVKQADDQLLATERRDLLAASPRKWTLDVEPLPERIEPWTPEQAEQMFLYRFHALNSARRVAGCVASLD